MAFVHFEYAELARNVNRKYSMSGDFNYEARMEISRQCGKREGRKGADLRGKLQKTVESPFYRASWKLVKSLNVANQMIRSEETTKLFLLEDFHN